jgi:hypothetical protein
MGDCGLELCIFSSNYKVQEEQELTVQQKRDYRKWKSERKRLVRDAGLVDEPVVDGLGGGGIEEEVEEQDVNTSSESTISHQEQGLPDTASTTHYPITPIIPTSPKAGRHAKGSRLNLTSASSPVPTSSTLKRKACVAPSQNTPTPASKKHKTGPSGLVPSLQTMAPGSVVPELSKSATKRLKRQAKKASEKAHGKPQEANAVKLHSHTAEFGSTAKPLDIIPCTTSASANFPTLPSTKSQQTCFLWYHDSCPKKGKQCADLHALTQPPSYVVAPVGYIHEKEVCGRDWCAGDWRDEAEVGEEGDEAGGWDNMDGSEIEDDEDEKIRIYFNWVEIDEVDGDEQEVKEGLDGEGEGDVEQGDPREVDEEFTEEERDSYWDYKSVDSCSITKDDSGENDDDAATEGE